MRVKKMKALLESRDAELMKMRNENKKAVYYRHLGVRKNTIKTMMGPITYSRAYYRRTDKTTGEVDNVYLLDEHIGLDTIGKISMNLALRCAAASCEMSYREAAKSITSLCGQDIGHMAVWQVVQNVSEKLKTAEGTKAIQSGHSSLPGLNALKSYTRARKTD